ncbi:hypothetical protein LCGC14_0698860 [marine sediment metagenome]|uniref:Uncharacterized protein n=1 Tax=marine sediment metagenome TaxID=412755 RepID=A0A0F9R3T5_9ZZZZ
MRYFQFMLMVMVATLLLPKEAEARKPECRYTNNVWFWMECTKGKPCRLQLGFQVFAYNHTKKAVVLVERCTVKGPGRYSNRTATGSYTPKSKQNMLGGLVIVWRRYYTVKTKRRWRYSCTCKTRSGVLLSRRNGVVWSHAVPMRRP